MKWFPEVCKVDKTYPLEVAIPSTIPKVNAAYSQILLCVCVCVHVRAHEGALRTPLLHFYFVYFRVGG